MRIQLIFTAACLLLADAVVQGFPWRQRAQPRHSRPSRHATNRHIHPHPKANCTYDLWVSHYSGKVYTLNYNPHGKNGQPALTIKQTLESCGGMPSWLTFDSGPGLLYCIDESYQPNGTLTMYEADSNSVLTEKAKVETLPGGVATTIFDGLDDQEEFLAIAHYEGSAISTFQIPITNSSTARQTFEFSMSQPGPNPSRQDAPHPHEVFTDPGAGYILSPDLGMDLVHIYQITGSGDLNECTPLSVNPGNGPRHGAWYVIPGTDKYILYIVNELVNTVDAYPMNWGPGECISFNTTSQVVAPYPAGKTIPSSATVAEIHSTGAHMFVSVRNDEAFGPNDDSMAAMVIDKATGHLSTDANLTSSYGRTPRTFDINFAAGLIAIGNQASSTVAIVEIDPTTGEPGNLLAELQVGPAGVPGQSNGLSSVIWRQ